MKKAFTIKNKKGYIIHGVIEYFGKKYGPVILVCHGYKGFIGQTQIKETAKALAKEGFTAVRFDATNCPGKSQGPLVDFTVTSYIDDIESVINYILKKTKQSQLIFFGFSIAAMAGYTIASKSKKFKALIFQGPSYDYTKEYGSKKLKGFNKNGEMIIYGESLERNVRSGNAYIKQMIQYGANKYLRKITCPTLILYGSKEGIEKHQSVKKIFSSLKTKNKKLVIIKGAHHTMRTKKELKPFIKEFSSWLKENNLY